MRIYLPLFIIFLIIINTPTDGTRRIFVKKQAQQSSCQAEHLPEKSVIIFDLINVLFKESYIGFAQKIGYSTLTSYALTHWKNPGHRCLDMLNAMSNNAT